MQGAIDVNNLSFSYNGKPVIKDFSFSVNKGDFLGIIGANGSGKSTLIKLLVKILEPCGGEIKILGQRISSFKSWNKIGYISQKASSFNSSFPATVEEVVSANMYSKTNIFKKRDIKIKEEVYNALQKVDMHQYGKSLIGNLSGGQQQRVFIARVLVSRPEIMFLDEPTVGIDAKSEEAVYCLLARLNKELGITIVMVTHDIGAITVHANKLLFLSENGLILQSTEDTMTGDFISKMYGYGINFQSHICRYCNNKGEN